MAVNLSPVGGVAQQFFDNNGNPLSGGKIYTYAAGTTTPQATYVSAAGATPHSNPIILDSAGRVPGGEIWLTDSFQYKFAIYTSTNVLIGTYDNIIGINSNFVNFDAQNEFATATAGQTVFTLSTINYTPGTNTLNVFIDGVKQYVGTSYTETDGTTVTFTQGLHVGALVEFTTAVTLSAGVTAAGLVTYTANSLGAVAQTVEDKLDQFLTVQDFGAVGDGIVDDTAALTAQYTAQNCYVLVPGKTYLITDSLPLNTYTRVIGNGAIILVDYNGPAFENKTGASILYPTMENIIIRANQVITASALPLTDVSRGFFQNITIDRAAVTYKFAYGVRLLGAVAACYWNKFYGVEVTAVASGGIRIGSGSNDNFFYDFRMINHISGYPTPVGIWLENGANNQFFGCSLEAVWDASGGNAYAVRIDTGCDGNGFFGLRTEGHGASVDHYAFYWNGGLGNTVKGNRILGINTNVGDPAGNEWDGINTIGGAAAGYMGSTQMRLPYSAGAPTSDAGAVKYNTTVSRFQGFRDSARDFTMSPAFFTQDMADNAINKILQLQLKDSVTAPATAAGYATLFVDSADGALKVKFGDGTVKTLATNP